MKKYQQVPASLSISKVHQILGLNKPTNPLVSVIDFKDISIDLEGIGNILTYNFYYISFIKNCDGFSYGQQYYDFEEGTMSFIAPNQVIKVEKERFENAEGCMLLIHPDFFNGNPIQSAIKKYGFFSYAINEALHLSAQEEEFIVGILKNIDKEIKSRIDKFTKDLIISHIDLLLKYSERFYSRQFITRKVVANDVLMKFEQVLNNLFLEDNLSSNGIPTVQQVASKLNMSSNYLSDLLRSYTGLSTLQHIQNCIIEKSKELLSTTKLSVNEIAFVLGFEHSQSFHRLFKRKTSQSPLEFRERFN
jgi:AraC-type DNA-binding domain-containing proteins